MVRSVPRRFLLLSFGFIAGYLFMRLINISNSTKLMLIDDEDVTRITNYSWSLNSNETIISANIGGKTTTIGRFILNYTGENQVDHEDLNILNNQKSNLRIATRSQNQQNRNVMSNNSTGYKGVFWQKSRGKYLVQIKTETQRIHIGRFSDPIEAAKAYDAAAIKHFGPFAQLNFK